MIGRGRQLGFSRAPRPVAVVCDPGALPSSLARRPRPRGFTLIELLITISIIAIMASMMLMALYGAGEAAKTAKTRALIVKLDAIIKSKYEAYKTRRLPVLIGPDQFTDSNGNGVLDGGETLTYDWNSNTTYDGIAPPPYVAARMRLDALRDLIRMELPDRWTDVFDPPVAPLSANVKIARPAVNQGYLRRYNANLSRTPPPDPAKVGLHQSAECLYMIVMSSVDEDGDAREVFKAGDIGDVDEDGFPEFLDGWRRPIKFLRWAPGFQSSELQVLARGVASGGGTTVTVIGTSLAGAAGSYVGGVIVGVADLPSPFSPKAFDPTRMARIVGYQPTGAGAATITLASTPAPPAITGDVAILGPDPFDPSSAYPGRLPPSFALYPLIYSPGPDRCYGINPEVDSMPLQYSLQGLNPYYVSASGHFIGQQMENTNEDIYSPTGWSDNIHNHLIGTR